MICAVLLTILAAAQGSRVYRHAAHADTIVLHDTLSTSTSWLTVLINGRFQADCRHDCCQVAYSKFERSSNVHVYRYDNTSKHYSLLHGTSFSSLAIAPPSLQTCQQFTLKQPKRPRVLAYFTVENAPLAQMYQNMSINLNQSALLTVETIIQSNGTKRLKHICNTTGRLPVMCHGMYHATPLVNGKPNYSCFYRKRPHQAGLLPDCPDIEQNMEWYASLFDTNGIDVLIPDTTNLGIYPAVQSDMLNVRPVEVVAEELTRLRTSGKSTPSLAIWSVAGANTTMYQGLLPVYKAYPDIILRNDNSSKMIYFVDGKGNANGPDPRVVEAIESNSTVAVVQMWANLDAARAQAGEWSFFQPCARPDGKFTLTVLNQPGYKCNHLPSSNSALGSMASVAFAWQANYASLPFASPSKQMGLTFMAQFDDALRTKPDNLMLPSFNEWNSGSAVPDPRWITGFGSVGLAVEDQNQTFVDIYAVERGRTFEPTMEAGDFYMRLAASCIRVAALLWSQPDTTCTVVNEICCQRAYANYSRVYSLHHPTQDIYRVTRDPNTMQQLIATGFEQICATAAGGYSSDVFCFKPGITTIKGRQGPFILYQSGTIPPPSNAGHLDRLPRVAVYSCPDAEGKFQLCNTCSNPEGELLGYAATTPSSAMPRALRRCTQADGRGYHVTDWHCKQGDLQSLLGHVL
eukprot:TRINITY_DN8197_c0_g1_i1.p1 TRINITY_DN8197_c0_g1~~TRINITY_DN8197_c0_g1_i1.p1  ORF type:complete len:688 (+),score=134.69 TRINITY_DN8197_c0_g1_i1:3-2066(+)